MEFGSFLTEGIILKREKLPKKFLKRQLKTQEVNLDAYQRSVEIAARDIERIKKELEKLK